MFFGIRGIGMYFNIIKFFVGGWVLRGFNGRFWGVLRFDGILKSS